MPFVETSWAPTAYAYISQNWPYLNKSIAEKRLNHLITLSCDHGPGDCDYVPRPIGKDNSPWWWAPAHPDRVFSHLQFNGLRDGADSGQEHCLVCFQQGKDIQLVTAEMVCGPLCGYKLGELRRWSLWGKAQARKTNRTNLLFYSGRIQLYKGERDRTGRAQIYLHHKNRTGYRIINTAGDDKDNPIDSLVHTLFVSYAQEAASAEFCYSPLGGDMGDTDATSLQS